MSTSRESSFTTAAAVRKCSGVFQNAGLQANNNVRRELERELLFQNAFGFLWDAVT